MTRVGPADQLLLLLQERLATLGKDRTGKAALSFPREPDALTRARALAAFEGLDPDERRRAVIRGLLVRQFGDGVANDPAFAGVAAEVARIIGEDEGARDLLDRVFADLTPSAI